MENVSINDILHECGLSSSPGYYAGQFGYYPNAETLIKISQSIKENYGDTAQEAFSQMVMDLPTLKTAFFVSFVVKLPIIANGSSWWWRKHVISHYREDAEKMPKCVITEKIKQEFKQLLEIKRSLN